MSAPACSRLRMSSSMHSSGKARAPSMLSWVTPERQRAQSWRPGHHGWASGVILTTVGHGRLKAVQRPLILTEVIRHVPISVDGQEVGTTAGRMDRGFGHRALLPHGRFWSTLYKGPWPGAALQNSDGGGPGPWCPSALDPALKPGRPSPSLHPCLSARFHTHVPLSTHTLGPPAGVGGGRTPGASGSKR